MRYFLPILVSVFFLSGCSLMEQYYDRWGYPYPRNDRTVYGDSRYDHDVERIRRDVRRHVDRLDRRLRLRSRQEREIRRLLEDRTYRQLRRHNRRAYPFPRSRNRARDFWRDADRAIERRLDRHQRREYRYMTGRSNRRRYDRGDGWWERFDPRRRGDDDDRDDEWYEDRDDDD